jgi:hypothetical protein
MPDQTSSVSFDCDQNNLVEDGKHLVALSFGTRRAGSEKVEEFLDRETGLIDDRGERPAFEISAVERKRGAELRLVGVLEVVVGSFDVMNIKTCPLESPKDFGGREGR